MRFFVQVSKRITTMWCGKSVMLWMAVVGCSGLESIPVETGETEESGVETGLPDADQDG